jgi:hypothetical protein
MQVCHSEVRFLHRRIPIAAIAVNKGIGVLRLRPSANALSFAQNDMILGFEKKQKPSEIF